MGIDITRFKLIYNEKVWQPVALMEVTFAPETNFEALVKEPAFIEVLVLNSDGNIIALRDEAWTFQFIKNIEKH